MAEAIVNSGDSDDPNNYVSFDDYLAGASKVWRLDALAERWNDAHPDDRVDTYGNAIVRDVAPNSGALSSPTTADGMAKVFAAVQLVGGGVELFVAGGALLAPEPTGGTKVVGWLLLLHSVDTMQAATRTLLTGDRTATFTAKGAEAGARVAHASPRTAETIGIVTDVTIGAAGTFGVGALSRVPVGATQLVHLTSADSAAAIRATETFGLGSSTLYAGPKSLAGAKGLSILARTGVPAGKATDVILLPSKASEAFLVVQPMGPFSGWQAINGTVFSAGSGSLNLVTGAFTRTGVATNQLAIYGFDSAVMATIRGAPGVIDAQFR